MADKSWIASGVLQAIASGTDLLPCYPCCFQLKKAAMYPISATRTSTVSVRDDGSDDLSYTRNAAHRTDTFEGYGHLLENTTLEEVLGEPDLHNLHINVIRRALVHGYFPCRQNESDYVLFLTCWLVQHKQAKLLCLWLERAPLSIMVLTKEIAAGLLAIMQSTLSFSFSGLTLELAAHLSKNSLKEVIPLLGQAFEANACLTKITIFSENYDSRGLAPLFDVLAEVAGLELVTEGGTMGPTDFALVSNLLSRNKALRVLALHNLGCGTFDDGKVAPVTGSAAGVIKHIAGQLHLERLELSNVPPQCQAVIGELMCTSHVLNELKIGLDGSKVDKVLVDGFSRTSSVESVCLSVLAFEDDMLALITSIAKTNVSIKSLGLRSRYRHEDLNDNSGICRLISSHRYLASLTWQFPAGCKVDLVKIGAALEKNIRLETLMLHYQEQSNDDCQPDWINETSISALAEKLKKNHTLTELVLASDDEMQGPIKKNYSVLSAYL